MVKKAKKKNIKRIIAIACAVAIVVLLALMPLLFGKKEENDGPAASILSATVETGSINKKVIGGGTLSGETEVTISVPSSVKLTKYLVSDGAEISQGAAVASVDRVTVMTAIAEVQETLDLLSADIEAEGAKETDSSVTALKSGTVKILYAEKGGSVQDVMLEHGALAVLSLDGRMAVDIEAESDLKSGSIVTLTFADNRAANGKVESNLQGKMTVTAEDDGYTAGNMVSVSTTDGTLLGEGELYIHSPWKATAYSGTVSSVNVSEGDSVKSESVLFEITDSGYSGTYRQLINKRQSYEALMTELFKLYQTETLTAPCDGIFTSADSEDVVLTSAKGADLTVTLLSNSPDGNDEASYDNYIGKVTDTGTNGWSLSINPESVSVTDYKNLSVLSYNTSAINKLAVYDPGAEYGAPVPIFELKDNAWVQIDSSAIKSGDILLFACDTEGEFVWIVRVKNTSDTPDVPDTPDTPDTPGGTDTPANPDNPSGQDIPSGGKDIPSGQDIPSGGKDIPSGQDIPSGGNIPNGGETPSSNQFPQTGGNTSSFGFPSGSGFDSTDNSTNGFTLPDSSSGMGMPDGFSVFSSDGMPEEEEDELYALDVTQIGTIAPQDTVTMDITVSELDVALLELGMEAEIQIDALGGEKVVAGISDIDNTGTNEGGFSFFTVTLTMERTENMLPGMNAYASIVTDSAENALTVPAEALVEKETETVIYTGYDEESKMLTDPVNVTIGASDGQKVEITDGLVEGDTVYYEYYDTLVISDEPDFSGAGFGGGMFGGRGGFPFGK